MSEFINLEDKANTLLKKLGVLLDDLSSNLSKQKTEKALDDGNECINEIENIIEQLSKTNEDNFSQNNIFIMKGDLNQKKEKFEKIQQKYILNKSNQLIESVDSTNIQEEDNKNDVYGQNDDDDFKETKNDKIIPMTDEQNNDINEKDYADEIFHVNKDVTELSEEYIHNDNCLFLIKRKIYKFFTKICDYITGISPKKKYLFILIILFILLVICVILLFFQFF